MSLDHLDTIISFVALLAGASLLVTTLTQAISALLALRGTNLRWGIATLLAHADPDLAPHARAVSEKVLHHALVSDSTMSTLGTAGMTRWRLATGIRQDELIAILHSLARQADAPPDGAPAPAWAVALRDSLDVLDGPEAGRLLALAPAIRTAFADDAAAGDAVIARLTQSAETISAKVDQWFDSVMDRVSQRFAMHARIWTIVFSTVLAFGLHLDAFRLLAQLSASADLRGRVLASADALSRQAGAAPTAQPDLRASADRLYAFVNDNLRFSLIPDPYPPIASYWTPDFRHGLGTLATAALLSLGAPFWFNLLKDLSNLRPTLAKKQAQETSADSDGG